MSSVFRQFLSCCFRTRSQSHERQQGGPDERTHLIPPTNEVPPVRTYVLDQHKMKERLGTIVRAQEGKMVNVNAQLPFNLHSQSLHALDPGAERSRSMNPPGTSTTQRIPSYSPARDESPSLQTSRSTSSLHPGDASYLPPEEDPEYGARRPAFNVRLVRAPGAALWTRRGRSLTRGRYSRWGDERLIGAGNGNGNGNAAEGNGVRVTGQENGVTLNGHADAADGPAAGSASTAHPPIRVAAPLPSSNGPDAEAEGEARGDGGATPHAPGFRIQIEDVGKISQSWGD